MKYKCRIEVMDGRENKIKYMKIMLKYKSESSTFYNSIYLEGVDQYVCGSFSFNDEVIKMLEGFNKLTTDEIRNECKWRLYKMMESKKEKEDKNDKINSLIHQVVSKVEEFEVEVNV